MKKFLFLVLVSAVLLAACADPAANKPKATTTDATNNSATNTPANSETTGDPLKTMETEGTALPVTPENSKIEFTGSKVTGKHDGGFKNFNGVIDFVNKKPEDSRVAVEIDMTSVFTDADGLTDHLKTADFFDVEKYPKATFSSTKIVPDVEKGAGNYIVTGDFNLHGTKKAITFPAKITVNDAGVAVNSEFAINRKDFGIVYAGKTDDLIRDDVVIRLDLNSPRKN